MLRRKLSPIVFTIGLVFILANFSPTLTGKVISDVGIISYFSWIGLVFILGSLLMFVSRKSLDSIIIPTGGDSRIDMERTKEGKKAYQNKKEEYFVISGNIMNSAGDKSKTRDILNELKSQGIDPSQITIEGKSKDSIGNIINSFKKIKQRGGKKVGIVSYDDHLDRFEDIFNKAQGEGLIDSDFKLYKVPTTENNKEKFYEVLAHVLHKYKLRNGIGNYLKRPDPILSHAKNLVLKAKGHFEGK